MSLISQVFLRYYHVDELNASLQKSVRLVVTCQAYVRGLIARHQYQNELQIQNETMCLSLQQLVFGISSELAGIQEQHRDEDRNRHIAKVDYYVFMPISVREYVFYGFFQISKKHVFVRFLNDVSKSRNKSQKCIKFAECLQKFWPQNSRMSWVLIGIYHTQFSVA